MQPAPVSLGAIAASFMLINFAQMHVKAQAIPESGNRALINQLTAQLDRHQERRELMNQQLQKAAAELKSLDERRRELIAQQHDKGISEESFSEIMKTLQSQRVQLSIDLAGLNARREAIVAERDQQSGPAHAHAALVEKLGDLVDLQKQEFAQLEQLAANNTVSQRQLNQARKQLMESEIRLLEAQAQSSVGGQPEMNQQLLDLSLDRAETTARLQKIDSLLVQFASARSDIDAAALIRRQHLAKEQEMIEQQNELRTLEVLLSDIKEQIRRLRDDQEKF